MKHIFTLNKATGYSINQQAIRPVIKLFFLLCFIACPFSYSTYAQTDKNAEQKEQDISQLGEKMTSFLSTINSKEEQIQLQIDKLEAELEAHQAKKTKKKNQAEYELITESLESKIADLYIKKRQCQTLRNEAMTLISTVKDKQDNSSSDSKTLNSGTNSITQNQQKQTNTDEQRRITKSATSTAAATSSDKERQIQEMRKNIALMAAEIERRKQANQSSPSSEREKQIQESEKDAIAQSAQVEQQTQDEQKQVDINTNPLSTPSSIDKEKQIQELKRTVADLSAQMTANAQKQDNVNDQKQRELALLVSEKEKEIQQQREIIAELRTRVQSQSQSQKYTQIQSFQPASSQSQLVVTPEDVSSGYYVVFGSFAERNNADRFLAKLKRKYNNVTDLGNDNAYGMYRTGIGPYKTKEEAANQRPTDARSWLLRVETLPNTKILAYFEILED